MIRALLFDFGGTLDTDGIHWSEKFFDLYVRLNLPVSKSDYEKAYVAGEKRMAREPIASTDSLQSTLHKQILFQLEFLAAANLLESTLVNRLAQELAAQAYSDVKTQIEVVKPSLLEFKKRYQLALVSNFTGNLKTVVYELGIGGIFDEIIDSAVVGISKPDSGIFALAAERLKVGSKECVVVGDSYERDIEPASHIGMKTVFLYGRSWKDPVSTESANCIIHSIRELPAALEKLTSRS